MFDVDVRFAWAAPAGEMLGAERLLAELEIDIGYVGSPVVEKAASMVDDQASNCSS